MFKKLFGGNKEKEEEVFETVDPVIEQRRMEKFSTPLIYNDEVKEEPKEKTEIQVEEKEKEIKDTKEVAKKKTIISKPQSEPVYRMSEIISPMHGVQQKKKPEIKSVPVKTKKVKKESNGLIQIISPFYGNHIEVDETEKKSKKAKKEFVSTEKTVEENLRNIATIVEEEQDQLKIIEQRTGEFKFDFSSKEDSLIDEINDSMSLDELMNLYEKKFKD